MNEWYSWFGLITTTSAVCIMAEFFIPKGKIGKSINIILSMFVISAILGTINMSKQNLSLKLPQSDEILPTKNAKKFTDKIEKQTQNLINKSLETVIRHELADFKINPEKIEIFTDKDEGNCIVMIRCKIYIQKNEPGDTQKAKENIRKNLGICTEFIEV